jgi:hypothetical protein
LQSRHICRKVSQFDGASPKDRGLWKIAKS